MPPAAAGEMMLEGNGPGSGAQEMVLVSPRRRTTPSGGRWRGFALVAVVGMAWLSGCTTIGGMPGTGGNGSARESAEGRNAGTSQELAEARRLVEGGSYSQALPRLLDITARDQQSAQAAEAFYLTGVAYHHIGSLGEAAAAYKRAVDIAPEGAFAPQANAALEAIKTEVDSGYVTPEEFPQLIAKVEARVAAEPHEIAHRLLLADLLWKQGDFARAGELYQKLLAEQPGLAQDRVISQRMQRQTDGTWQVMTPEAVIQQQAQANPVTIYGTSSFRSTELRGDLRYYTVDFYHVSGHVVNQSQGPVRNVAVDVTLYGFGDTVYETQTVQLGTLPAGQHRTFAVRFSQFDNINNVQRYTCQLRYDQ